MRLTELSRGSGCGCKIAPAHLQEILKSDQLKHNFENLLVGYETSDDAAVYQLNESTNIISTTDFFTPIVDNPFHFGEIAAANAISDVYAMGGKPLMALGILGFPIEKFETEVARNILDGARSKCLEAGIPLAGGHSIDSLELFFGLAVTGINSKNELKTNANAQVDDVLFLTKPIGTGVLASAHKRGLLTEEEYPQLYQTASSLNTLGGSVAKLDYVHAITDVTGFGLLGHAIEMAKAAELCVALHTQKIPTLDSFQKYTASFVYPDNTTKNYSTYHPLTTGMDGMEFLMYCDPQTNGGLLISVAAQQVNEFLHHIQSYHPQQAIFQIGCFEARETTHYAKVMNA
jgi:selenide,water dikinase